jgi:trehalose synthase
VSPLLDAEALEILRTQAAGLRGVRLLHLSASPLLSAVSETLRALVPLQRALGIRADWRLVGDLPRACTRLYEGLRGDAVRWGAKESDAWHQLAGLSGTAVPAGYDAVVVHDPQLLPFHLESRGARGAPWIWQCHLDPGGAGPALWADVATTLDGYAAALFPSARATPERLPISRVRIAQPVLDPGSARNRPLSDAMVRRTLRALGIDPQRPLLGQFAPIDHRFAPLAALGTYWLARRTVPGLQIVLAETTVSPALRAPEGWRQIQEAAAGDPDIHLFPAAAELGADEVNALQRGCSVALQMAVPRGFGWGVAECQWKRKPAVVGTRGELPDQVANGSGYVVDAAPVACAHVLELLAEPERAARLGSLGHQHIASSHLITRLASDYSGLLYDLVARPIGSGLREDR